MPIYDFFGLISLVNIGPYSLNGFDTVICIILIISMLYALSRGLVREVISLIALLLATTITLFIWGRFRFAFQDFISPDWLANAALVIGAWALSYLLIGLILRAVGKSITGESPGFFDRLLGAGFGVLRGLVISALLVMAMTASHRASVEAKTYRDTLISQGIYEEMAKKMPAPMREKMNADPVDLPKMLENSTFYPLLDRIGNILRALPFAKMKSYAERIKGDSLANTPSTPPMESPVMESPQ